MGWEQLKKKALEALEKALSEDKVDSQVIPLLEKLNARKEYFTTSSCSGRIVLLASELEDRKITSYFWRKWHRKVAFQELLEGIMSYKGDKILWLKLEPFILHVSCKTLSHARALMEAARHLGVKKLGVFALSEERVVVELCGSEWAALPVYDEKPLVTEEYVRYLTDLLNFKLERNYMRLQRLTEGIDEELNRMLKKFCGRQ